MSDTQTVPNLTDDERREQRKQDRRAWYLDALAAVRNWMLDDPALPAPWRFDPSAEKIEWYCHSAAETKATFSALGGRGDKIERRSGAQALRGERDGWTWEIVRLDLTCELVETDEVEEVDEVEVVRPAETRTVKVQRPKLRKVCPPILADVDGAA